MPVVNETTLQAAQALVAARHRPLALNFANGVSPGGGFLNGAGAQEETLCRSSAPFATLDGDPMYAAHRERLRPDSSDWTILSPDVPVFRTDGGHPLDRPWRLCLITAAVPVATRIGQPEAAAPEAADTSGAPSPARTATQRWYWAPALCAMTQRLTAALRAHRHLRGRRVLASADGAPLTQKVVQGFVRRAARRAQQPDGVHILRHTFCSHLAMRGAPTRAIQELAGHKDFSTTQRYMHLSPAATVNAMRLLDHLQTAGPSGEILETGESRS